MYHVVQVHFQLFFTSFGQSSFEEHSVFGVVLKSSLTLIQKGTTSNNKSTASPCQVFT